MLPTGHHFDGEGPDVYNIWLMVKTILRLEKLGYEWHISDLPFRRFLITANTASVGFPENGEASTHLEEKVEVC